MNRQDACSTRKFISRFTGILPVLKNSARCELQPADPLKNPVSLILVHHPKSDFNTPFIIESASTHISRARLFHSHENREFVGVVPRCLPLLTKIANL